MSIILSNPRELPFGSLSNNAIYKMKIGNDTYNTVTNYIYSKMCLSKEHFSILKNINTHDIHKYLSKYNRETIEKSIRESLKKAVNEKFKDKYEELILSTEDYPIVYIDNDMILGSGPNGTGQNLLGKYLMEIRTTLNSKKGTKDQKLYEAYTALKLLEKLIQEKNDDLRTFAGLNQSEIINKYIHLKAIEDAKVQNVDLSKLTHEQITERYKYFVQFPDKNIIQSLTFGDNIKVLKLLEASLKRPYLLSLYVKKKYYAGLRAYQLEMMRNTVFDIYIKNVLETKYPALPKDKYQKAIEQEFSSMKILELDALKDQLITLYKENLLPKVVMTSISESINTNMLSEKAVKNAEQFNVEYMYENDNEYRENLIISFSELSNIDDTPYYIFSPIDTTDMIKIDGMQYPSIIHYIIANLFIRLPEIQTNKNAHKYLLYDIEGDKNNKLNYYDYQYLYYRYNTEKTIQFIALKKKLATIALNKKFEDTGLQELLIATGNNDLLWVDHDDTVLGTSKTQEGENFVGRYLSELRDKFKQDEDKIEAIAEKDIANIMQNDIFMRSWLEMRMNDICKVTKEIKKYVVTKYKKEVTIDINFLMNVLNYIYQPCYDLVQNFDDKTESNPPKYFADLVGRCFGFKNITPEMIKLLWKRITILIYFILKNVNPKLRNVKTVLAKIELLVSAKTNCINIVDNREDNCIISALVNILKKLIQFNIQSGNDSLVSKYDVETAINIILNKTTDKLDDKMPDFSSFIKQNELNDDVNILNVGEYGEQTDEQTEEQIVNFELKKQQLLDELSDYDDDENQDMIIDDSDDEISFEDVNDSGDGASKQKPRRNKTWEMLQRTIDAQIEKKERLRFEKYKNVNKIVLHLDINNIKSKNNTTISEYIIDAVNIIKNYRMSNKVKINRINFFATTS